VFERRVHGMGRFFHTCRDVDTPHQRGVVYAVIAHGNPIEVARPPH
jgi:hypothetical protein